MAANSCNRAITTLGNQFVNRIYNSSAASLHPNLIFRRAVHESVYDKNIEDQVRPSLVPEEAITRAEPEKYWAPHPKTGVFGPADEKYPSAASRSEAATDGSVLEEKTFFRPLENLEKPAHP